MRLNAAMALRMSSWTWNSRRVSGMGEGARRRLVGAIAFSPKKLMSPQSWASLRMASSSGSSAFVVFCQPIVFLVCLCAFRVEDPNRNLFDVAPDLEEHVVHLDRERAVVDLGSEVLA